MLGWAARSPRVAQRPAPRPPNWRRSGRQLAHAFPGRVRCDAVHQGLFRYPGGDHAARFVVAVGTTAARLAGRIGKPVWFCVAVHVRLALDGWPRRQSVVSGNALPASHSQLGEVTRSAKALPAEADRRHEQNDSKGEALSDPTVRAVDHASAARYGFRYCSCRIVSPASLPRHAAVDPLALVHVRLASHFHAAACVSRQSKIRWGDQR